MIAKIIKIDLLPVCTTQKCIDAGAIEAEIVEVPVAVPQNSTREVVVQQTHSDNSLTVGLIAGFVAGVVGLGVGVVGSIALLRLRGVAGQHAAGAAGHDVMDHEMGVRPPQPRSEGQNGDTAPHRGISFVGTEAGSCHGGALPVRTPIDGSARLSDQGEAAGGSQVNVTTTLSGEVAADQEQHHI